MESASGQLLGYPWKLGGITVQTSYVEGRWHQNRVRSRFCKWRWKYMKNGFFVNCSVTENFQHVNFSGWGPSELPQTQLSEYLHEKGVEIFFDCVLTAQSWEVGGEWPAKLGRCNEKLLGQLSTTSETLSCTHLLLRSRSLEIKLHLTAM